MADTFTTNLSLTKPDIGGSTDTWGNKLNANADALDALFPSGDLAVANGGTGASDAATARTNLGLGTMATQNASAVNITGGSAAFDLGVSIAGTYCGYYLRETDAPANNQRWAWLADGQQIGLRLYADNLVDYGQAITVSRSGTSPSVVNIGTTLQVNGNVAYHAGNISAATITESQITDGTVLARVAANETVTGSWTFSNAVTVPAATVTAHQGSLSIAEAQITDGSLLARVGNAENVTGAWSFQTIPTKYSGGKFIHYNSSSYTGGAVTVSTSTPSGTPGEGDLWFRYTA